MADFEDIIAGLEITLECAVYGCSEDAVGDVLGADAKDGRQVRFPLCGTHAAIVQAGPDEQEFLFDNPDNL